MSLFITLEGIEGSGKSTLQKNIASELKKIGLEVLLTREPGATEIGKAIREILLDKSHTALSPLTELILFAADRAQHVEEVVRPALKNGSIVISDRYTGSTLAYQGYGRGISMDTLNKLNSLATDELEPDLILLLDLDPQEGLARAQARAQLDKSEDSWTRFEAERLKFHTAVRDGYLTLAEESPEKYVVIDGTLSRDKLTVLALQTIMQRLELK